MKIAHNVPLRSILALVFLTLPALAAPVAPAKGGIDATGPYQVVANWFKPGVAQWNQPVTGVAVDTPDRIFVVSSGQQITQPGSLILGPNGATLNPVRNFTPPPIRKPDSRALSSWS